MGEILNGYQVLYYGSRNDNLVSHYARVLTPTGKSEDTRYTQDEQASYIGELVLDTYKPGRSWAINAGYHHRKSLSVEDIH